jgi:hypothetical protein
MISGWSGDDLRVRTSGGRSIDHSIGEAKEWSMTDVIISDKQLSSSVFSHVFNAPIEKVDIADWLFKLSEGEYRRCCPPDHIACGATSSDDGKPMSIHVEMIGRRWWSSTM